MGSPRVDKLADQIKVIVAEMLGRRIKDPRLGFVTLTGVRLTGDNQHASIFYTVMGGQEAIDGTAAALSSATGLIRSEVGKQLGLRHTPSIEFSTTRSKPSSAATAGRSSSQFTPASAPEPSGSAAAACRAAAKRSTSRRSIQNQASR